MLRSHDTSAVDTFLEGLNAHNSDKIRLVLAPDFEFEEVVGPGERSADALMVELQMVFDAFPDIVFRPVRDIKQSDRHLLEFRAFGTHRGEFLSVPPTNTTAIVSGVFNLQSDDGVIRRLRMTVDFGGLRRQLLVASRALKSN